MDRCIPISFNFLEECISAIPKQCLDCNTKLLSNKKKKCHICKSKNLGYVIGGK